MEGKNGHVIRKLFGYTHIPPRWAETLNHFHRLHTNPYHNYHRPCLFSETLTDPRGRQRKRYPYRLSMPPYDKLKSLPQAHSFLKPGVTFEKLDALAHETNQQRGCRKNELSALTVVPNHLPTGVNGVRLKMGQNQLVTENGSFEGVLIL